MSIRYDRKGKYFTEAQTKVEVRVLIQTQEHQLEGTIYIRPDERLIDMVNSADEFIAVTDVSIIGSNNDFDTDFLTLSKSNTIWIAPLDDMISRDSEPND
jgi:hypothetical protein